jgi:hypothetical protein
MRKPMQEEVEAALEAQAPVSDELDVEIDKALEKESFREKLSRAKMRHAASRANENALKYFDQVVFVTGMCIVEMQNSRYEYAEKGVVFTVTPEGKPGPTLDFYGKAGVESVRALMEELGEGPYPEPVPCRVEEVGTRWGERAYLVPAW